MNKRGDTSIVIFVFLVLLIFSSVLFISLITNYKLEGGFSEIVQIKFAERGRIVAENKIGYCIDLGKEKIDLENFEEDSFKKEVILCWDSFIGELDFEFTDNKVLVRVRNSIIERKSEEKSPSFFRKVKNFYSREENKKSPSGVRVLYEPIIKVERELF